MAKSFLPPDFRLDTPSALLDALARLAGAENPDEALWSRLPAEWQTQDARALGGKVATAAAALAPPQAPSSPEEREAWLLAVERISLAAQTLERLDERFSWAGDLRAKLTNLLVARQAQIRSLGDSWRYARLANVRCLAVGNVLPWSELLAFAPAQALSTLSPPERANVVAEWLLGTLSDEESDVLRGLVRSDDAWRSAYKERVQFRLAEARLLAVEEARVVLHVPLPHLGPGAAARLLVDARGLVTEWPSKASQRLERDVSSVSWPTDEILGQLSTRLTEVESRPVGLLMAALQNARKALAIEASTARLLALQATSSLADDSVVQALSRGTEAFRAGQEDELGELEKVARYAVEVRATLEEVASRFFHPEVLEALEACDETLSAHRDAVYLVSEHVLEEALGDRWVEHDAWWGRRRVPAAEQAVEQALRTLGERNRANFVLEASPRDERRPQVAKAIDPGLAMAFSRIFSLLKAPAETERRTREGARIAAQSGGRRAPAKLVAQASAVDLPQMLRGLSACPEASFAQRYEAAVMTLMAMPCPWLSPKIAQALADLERAWAGAPQKLAALMKLRMYAEPRPGAVPVLAAVEQQGSAGVWELRVGFREEGGRGDPWHDARRFESVARNTLRAAYFALASLLPGRVAPRNLEEHTFELVGNDFDVDALDGPSLALSAALAFASLWAGAKLPEDLAATGQLSEQGAEVIVLPVGWAQEKAQAIEGRGAKARLLVSTGEAPIEVGGELTLVRVGTLAEALRHTRLSPEQMGVAPDGLSAADRQRQLAGLKEDVISQRLVHYQSFGRDPWQVLADRMRRLIASLEVEADARSRRAAAEARAYAALAYTHAMDTVGVSLMLVGADIDAAPRRVKCFSHIVECGAAIDAEDWGACHRLQVVLDHDLALLEGYEREELAGMVLGAKGRAWMHERRLELALPLLRSAVEHNAKSSPREVGRSRISLAIALRMQDEAAEALAELERAAEDLARCRKEDPVYASQTEIFLLYELTRTLLETGAVEQAVQAGERALARARETGAWWPLLGIMRSLSLAYAAMGRDEAAATLIGELKQWAERQTPLAQELLAEATGKAAGVGEVY